MSMKPEEIAKLLSMKPEEIATLPSREDGNPWPFVGATLLYPQDRYPYLVVGCSESGKTLTLHPVRTVGGDTGHAPARFEGPWPVWEHVYTDKELGDLHDADRTVTARWSEAKGRFVLNGAPLSVGRALYYRNFSY